MGEETRPGAQGGIPPLALGGQQSSSLRPAGLVLGADEQLGRRQRALLLRATKARFSLKQEPFSGGCAELRVAGSTRVCPGAAGTAALGSPRGSCFPRKKAGDEQFSPGTCSPVCLQGWWLCSGRYTVPFPALAAAFHRFLEELQVFLHQSTRTLYKVFAGDSSFSLLFDALKYVFFLTAAFSQEILQILSIA